MSEENMVEAVFCTHILKNKIYRHFQTIQRIKDYRVSGLFFRIAFGALIPLFIQACTPALYHVDLKYQPTEKFLKLQNVGPDFLITVAMFNDVRKIDDKLKLGMVIIDYGSAIPIFPKYLKVPDAVTMNIRDYLFKSGYRISNDIPSWDLMEKTINKGWGKILIGGNINELTINCNDSFPVQTCQSKVNLTFTFVDVPKKRVIYHSSVESSAFLKDVFFSESVLETQINSAFSDALEKMFNDPEMKKQIDNTVKMKSEY